MSGAHLPGRCTCADQRRGGRQHLWPPAGSAVLLPKTGADGGSPVGTLGPMALVLRIPPRSLHAHHRRAAKPPGLCRFSQNPAFTLPVSEFLLVLFLSQTVVPKIANMRNHQEADSDANTRGIIYKLDLVSKYTQHSRAGTWTPRWVLA